MEGCHDEILRLLYCTGLYLSSILRIKLEKRGFDGCILPIMFPVTIGLGGSMAVTLNALASVPMTGGGGALLCSRPVDSLDAISIIDGRWLSSPC